MARTRRWYRGGERSSCSLERGRRGGESLGDRALDRRVVRVSKREVVLLVFAKVTDRRWPLFDPHFSETEVGRVLPRQTRSAPFVDLTPFPLIFPSSQAPRKCAKALLFVGAVPSKLFFFFPALVFGGRQRGSFLAASSFPCSRGLIWYLNAG